MVTSMVQSDFLLFWGGVLFAALIAAPSTDTETRRINSCEAYLRSKDLTCEKGVVGHGCLENRGLESVHESIEVQ